MKNIVLVYPAGYHGEFFIGNIVSNTDKFYYHSFKCRNEELNAYNYESTGNEIAHEQSAEDLKRCSELHNKPIIARSCDHHLVNPITKTKKSLNIISASGGTGCPVVGILKYYLNFLNFGSFLYFANRLPERN